MSEENSNEKKKIKITALVSVVSSCEVAKILARSCSIRSSLEGLLESDSLALLRTPDTPGLEKSFFFFKETKKIK